MKKEILICDLCGGEDLDEMATAKSVCPFCKKDMCEDCEREVSFGYLEQDETLIRFVCCEGCDEKMELDMETDKSFLEGLKEKMEEYLKKKLIVENLK